MRVRRLAVLLTGTLLLLGGCVLLDIIAFPFKLLFQVLNGIGKGVSSAVDAVSVVEPVNEGDVPPSIRKNADGTFLVEAPETPRPFRIRVSAPGHAERVMTWPDDFRDERLAGDDGAPAAIRVFLDPAPATVR